MRTRINLALTAAAFGLAVSASLAVQAQGGKSVADGIYTEAQAKRGEKVYADTQCAACHGMDLKGNDVIPTLTGADFAANWKEKTAGDLFEKIKTTMPAVAPGSLTDEQTADVVAYILSVGKYPAGATELPSKQEALAEIKIEAPKQ